jgi:hypothetical protein
MLKYLLLAVEKNSGVTELSAYLIKTSKKMRESFLLLFTIFGLAGCQTPQEKAQEFVLRKGQACPNFGKLNREEIKQGIYKQNESDDERIMTAQGDVNLYWVTDALSIKDKKNYLTFTDLYQRICNTNVPFNDEIEYVKNAKQEDEDNIQSIAKAAKIKVDEIIDLRDRDIRNDFNRSWYNFKENPDIDNENSFGKDEFEFEKAKKKFQDLRKFKYAITNSFQINGDYDFKKQAFQISAKTEYFERDYIPAFFTFNKPFTSSSTIKSSIWFSIPPDKAKQFKENGIYGENIIILTKFSPTYHKTTIKCDTDSQHLAHCLEHYSNKELKLKYLSTETLKYRIVYDGEVYANY